MASFTGRYYFHLFSNTALTLLRTVLFVKHLLCLWCAAMLYYS